MNSKFARWGLSQLIVIMMLAVAGSAFAAPGDGLLHNSSTLKSKYGKWGVTGGKYGKFTCSTCHTQTTNNVKRVQQSIATPNLANWSSSGLPTVSVVFNNMTAFGTDATAHTTSTAICQVCHSKTTVHRYKKPAGQTNSNHQNANQTDCTQCHNHARAFAPTCNSCHGYPPQLAAIGVDGMATPATNALGGASAGAHMAHDGFAMKCVTCHNNFDVIDSVAHQTANKVEIGFAANATNYPTWAGPAVTTGTFDASSPLNVPYTWQANTGSTVTTGGTQNCTVYCHGSTLTGGAGPRAWTSGVAGKACGSCHTVSAASPPASNAHTRHAGTLSTTNLGIACDKCHGAHPDNTHVSGVVKWDLTTLPNAQVGSTAQYKLATVSNTGALAPSVSWGNCSNIYCHSNVQGTNGTGAPTVLSTPAWNLGSVACNTCHLGDVASGFNLMSSGSHRRHVAVASGNIACGTCHSAAGRGTDKHADGIIQVTLTTGGTYSNPTKAAGVGVYGTCSNTAGCHNYSAAQPIWGGTINANCDGCHGNRTTALTRLSGPHNAHIAFPATGGGYGCLDCHANVLSAETVVSANGKALHMNTFINFSGAMAPKQQGAAGTITCSTTSCHNSGKNLAPRVAVTWNASTIDCSGCHGSAANSSGMPSPDAAGVNAHVKHLPTTDTTKCVLCHAKTVNSSNAIIAGSLHLNKTRDARLSKINSFAAYSGSFNSAARTCSATYCHGGTNGSTPAWGTVTLACNACHEASNALPGSHSIHVNGTVATSYTLAAANTSAGAVTNFTCASCHGATSTNHVDGPKALSDATLFYGFSSLGRGVNADNAYVRQASGTTDAKGFKYTTGGSGNCNATYCHSNGAGANGNVAQNWGTAATNACNVCHGNQASVGGAALSYAHNKHMTGTTGGVYKCKDCHAQVISNADNLTLLDKSKHVNKMVNYSGQFAGKNKTCATIYCHSNGKGTYTAPVWTGTNALGCGFCHGTSNGFGRPDNSTPNSHPIHAASGSDCYKCHRLTASSTVGVLVPGNVDHIDGTIDARFSKMALTNYSGIYNVAKTCSATYCHGGSKTTAVAWGAVGPLACNTCHAASNALPGAHNIHLNATIPGAGSYTLAAANTSAGAVTNFTCASCHGNTASNHANGPALLNSDATVFFGFSTVGKNPAYARTGTVGTDADGFKWMYGTGGACNATYCHSNGRGGAGLIGASLTWNSGTTATCITCHGSAASANGVLSGAHFRHFSTSSFKTNATRLGCKDCHAQTVSGTNLTLTNKANHVNKLVNYSGQYAGKNKTCATIYCHSNGKGLVAVAPVWTNTNAVGCNFCHGSGSAPLSSSYGHTLHLADGATCSNCHSQTTTNNTSITGTTHIDGTVNLLQGGANFKSKAVSFTNLGGGSCNNISCHSPYVTNLSPTATWGTRASCETCHPKGNLTGVHLTHMGALDLTSASLYYNMTANRTPVQNDTVKQYGFGCANCHPMTLASHIDGSIQVDMASKNILGTSKLRFLNSTTAANLPVYSGGKCNNIYCHSNASRILAENVYKQTPAWVAGTFTGDRCKGCHENQPATGAHAAHAVGNHTDNIYNGTSGKVPTIKNKANTAHGNPANSTTIGCYICHQDTVTSSANDQNTRCSTCHNGTDAGLRGNAAISNLSNHVNGSREIKYAQIFVKSKAQVRQNSFKFYSGVWQRTSYKNMSTLSYDIAKVRLDLGTTWIPGTPANSSCANVVCHNGASPKWNLADWNDPNKCMDCHTKL